MALTAAEPRRPLPPSRRSFVVGVVVVFVGVVVVEVAGSSSVVLFVELPYEMLVKVVISTRNVRCNSV